MKILTTWTVLVALTLSATLLTACGGGGGGAPPTPLQVTAIVPETAYSLESFTLRIAGSGFGSPTQNVTVRLTAEAGTPFANGTSETLDQPGTVQANGNVESIIPVTDVPADVNVFVTVISAGGAVSTSGTPLLSLVHQSVTGFLPGSIDGSKSVPFTLAGTGFHPSMGTNATVFLEATSGEPFHAGDGPRSRISFPGTIDTDGQISGDTAYCGVLADTPVRVRVRLPNNTEILSTGVLGTVQQGTAGVQGTWTYERVPVTMTGLDYAGIFEAPIRGAKVQLLRASNNEVITTRALDASGDYRIDYGIAENVYVRVLAETGVGHPPIRVQDNTSSDALYSVEGAPFLIDTTFQTMDYVAGSGWTGATYGDPRASAPFALLDTCYEAAAAFLAVRVVDFPLCVVNWSVNNRPEDGDRSLGQIGGAHYDTNAGLFLSGQEDVDTDEFDAPLVVHEWGHYFTDKLGRSDTIAGPHAIGDQLEPSVAFDEGLASALAAIVLSPDTNYKDTYGPLQGTTFGFDIEDNSTDIAPGWFSETGVQCIIYDLFDSVSDDTWDTVALGLGPIYDVLTDPLVDTPYLTTIFSFIDALKATTDSATDTAIDNLCAQHVIDPINNAWGSGETNGGGWAPNLPVYHLISVGTFNRIVTLDSIYGWNQVEANRQIVVIGNGAQITVRVDTPEPLSPAGNWFHDVQIQALKDGEEVDWADDWLWGIERVVLPNTVLNQPYIIRIGSNYSEDAIFEAAVTVTSP